jgi:hypothetical protein
MIANHLPTQDIASGWATRGERTILTMWNTSFCDAQNRWQSHGQLACHQHRKGGRGDAVRTSAGDRTTSQKEG